MNLVGYKFYDAEKTRRSAEVLKMNKHESAAAFQKRCAKLGYECVDGRNLVDHYKFVSDELIQGDLEANRHPNLYILCVNIINDFNVASILRACNAFGVKGVYLYGDKGYDRRGTVGTHNYLSIINVPKLSDFYKLVEEFDEVVSLENCSGCIPLETHAWDYDKKTLIIIGQESIGVPGELLECSDYILEIRMKGCVRSINVAQATACALYDYNAKINLLA